MYYIMSSYKVSYRKEIFFKLPKISENSSNIFIEKIPCCSRVNCMCPKVFADLWNQKL